MDDLEATQASFKTPRTQEELDALLESMGADRPLNTFGATISETMTDDAGNPVAVDRNGNPINFEVNPDYDPNAKPSWENFTKKIPGIVEGVKEAASDPLAAIQNSVQNAGESLYEYGKGFTERLQTGQSTLGDVFDTIGTMIGVGPATSVATKGVRATVADLQDTSSSRMFLTPGTNNLTKEMRDGLVAARDMEALDVDPLEIKKKTGWENLVGKEWVYEIDDSQANILDTAEMNKVMTTKDFVVPGSKPTGNYRQKILLQAQRDIIELKKQLRAGTLSQDEFDTLADARQRALDNELNYSEGEKVIQKEVPLAAQLKRSGKLSEVLYHPELGDYVDMDSYTANVGIGKGSKNTWGDHNRYKRHINVYTTAPLLERLPTMVHEGQHFLDSSSNSPASGFNESRSHTEVKKPARLKNAARLRTFKREKLKDLRNGVKMYNTGTDKFSDEHFDRMIEKSISEDPDTKRSYFSEALFQEQLFNTGAPDPAAVMDRIKMDPNGLFDDLLEYADIRHTGRLKKLSSMDKFDVYERELGEVKARLAAKRQKLTPEQRANSLASDDIQTLNGLPIDLDTIFRVDEFE
jgi:hypothetical protein